jgi:hypothetical protein
MGWGSVAVWLSLCLVPLTLLAEDASTGNNPSTLVNAADIPRYTALRTPVAIRVDGKLDEASWLGARRTPRFVDLISGARAIHETTAAILWDDEYLYVGFWVEEPLLAAKYKLRDAPIYYDNDVEVFIAGRDAYYEFEVNAWGTIYEAFFIWEDAYERGGYAREPGFRRSDKGVQVFDGVGFKNHPRGKRIACIGWDFPQLRSAVHVDGTLNDDTDRDRGWTVELAFPWQQMGWIVKGDGRSLPPRDGDVWRIDLFRFNHYREAAPAEDSGGWALGRHSVWDSHIPEIFPYVTFSGASVLAQQPPGEQRILANQGSERLTTELLRTSLKLGTEFLINNQKPAGNFQYQYDWKRREYAADDNPVRQAGAGWGLATIYAREPSPQVEAALQKALDFMNGHSHLSEDGSRYVVYPGEEVGRTGTVALVALAHLDYLQSRGTADSQRARYRPFLNGYLRFLMEARRPDGLWHGSYDLQTGAPHGEPSPYFDGEALLALVKATKYRVLELAPDLLAAAQVGYARNVVEARAHDPDSAITKGYYQWSSMAFFELATSGWEGTEEFGDYVVELADWMIDVHKTLSRARNTAYAYEGIIHAYQLAKLRQDQARMEKFARVIDEGLLKLTSWQVGSPIANSYIRGTPTDDPRAIGGIQNDPRQPALRIDVAQHQMHAVTLALKYYLTDAAPEQ